MKVMEEIRKHAKEEDKPILTWLFDRYHMESEWMFVARCNFVKCGVESYKVHRQWVPTSEGIAIYRYYQIKEIVR